MKSIKTRLNGILLILAAVLLSVSGCFIDPGGDSDDDLDLGLDCRTYSLCGDTYKSCCGDYDEDCWYEWNGKKYYWNVDNCGAVLDGLAYEICGY